MTLQAGDKLMSLTDLSEMLGIPVHTLYRSGRPALANPGARIILERSRRQRTESRANQGWKRSSSTSAAPVARFLRPM